MTYVYSGTSLSLSRAPSASELLGALPDALECTVQRDTDGLFELSLSYPVSGENASYLQINNWLYAPAGGTKGMQYFRITQTTETISGLISVNACHLSYNALTILAAPFEARSSSDYGSVSYISWYAALTSAVKELDTEQLGGFNITGYTDDMTLNAAGYTAPVTMKQAILDAIKDVSGVYLDYSTFGFKIWRVPSFDLAPAFRIRYGRDMIGYSNSVDATEFYTHIFPYYMVDDEMVSYTKAVYPLQGLPEGYEAYHRLQPINLADYYTGMNHKLDQGIVESIITRWLKEHPWNPFPNEISVEQIPQDENEFELGNVGRLYYEPTKTVITAEIISLTYDVLQDRITAIGINKRQKDVADTIAKLL